MQRLLDHGGVAALSEFVWAHGVNDRAKLAAACADAHVTLLEADVQRAPDGRLVLAHPPARDSDLDFGTFLDAALNAGKGIKLDFKQPDIVAEALAEVARRTPAVPVLANADVLDGPGGYRSGFDATEFVLTVMQATPAAILSLGWETGWYDPTHGYTAAMAAEMLELVALAADAHVQFALRAAYVHASWDVVADLFERAPAASALLWDTFGDPCDAALDDWLRATLPAHRTSFDLRFTAPRNG